MKLTIGGILAALMLAGCSAGPTPSSQSPLDTKPDSSFDMCATMPGPDVAKALGVRVTEAKKDDLLGNTCNYTGMTECEKEGRTSDNCKVTITYTVNGWDEAAANQNTAEPVSGLGEKAYYNRLMNALMVKVGAKNKLWVTVGIGYDEDEGKQKRTDLAKAVLAKL